MTSARTLPFEVRLSKRCSTGPRRRWAARSWPGRGVVVGARQTWLASQRPIVPFPLRAEDADVGLAVTVPVARDRPVARLAELGPQVALVPLAIAVEIEVPIAVLVHADVGHPVAVEVADHGRGARHAEDHAAGIGGAAGRLDQGEHPAIERQLLPVVGVKLAGKVGTRSCTTSSAPRGWPPSMTLRCQVQPSPPPPPPPPTGMPGPPAGSCGRQAHGDHGRIDERRRHHEHGLGTRRGRNQHGRFDPQFAEVVALRVLAGRHRDAGDQVARVLGCATGRAGEVEPVDVAAGLQLTHTVRAGAEPVNW